MDESTIILRDFNTPLSNINKSIRQKISKNIVELNCLINQRDVTYTYRILHQTIAGSQFFQAHMEDSPI